MSSTIKDSKIKAGSLSDLSVDAFLLFDEKLNLLNINDAGQRLFGVSSEVALGKCIMDVMPNIKKSDIYNKYRHILKTGEPLVIHQKLGDRSLAVQVFKLGDSLGIIVSDITERKLADEALRNSEERYRMLVDSTDDVIFSYNLDGCFTGANLNLCRMLGSTLEQVIGKSYKILNDPPEQLRRWEAVQERVKSTGEMASAEISRPMPNGDVLYSDIRLSPVRDENGNVVGFSCISRDITERKRGEEALKKREALLNAMGRMAKVGGWEFGVATMKQVWTEEVYRIHEVDRNFEPDVGKCIAFYAPEAVPIIKEAVERAIAIGESFDVELPFITAKGNRLWVHTNGQAYREEEKTTKVFGIFQDITERKVAEKERERLLAEVSEKTKELEQVIYTTSHDLRSPLVNIQGFTKELDESVKQVNEVLNSKDAAPAVREKLGTTLNEDIPAALQFVLASSAKMDSILSGLLKISRLGRATLSIQKLDMNKLIAEVIYSLEFQVKETGANVEVGDLPPCCGDETQINQVFSNLLDNALKFLDPERPGSVRISGEAGEGRVVYCVEDNGIGIAEKDKGVIFGLFSKLDPDDKRGEGLGLHIVRKMLDRNGGKVWVESEPGKGSRFFVSLPNNSG